MHAPSRADMAVAAAKADPDGKAGAGAPGAAVRSLNIRCRTIDEPDLDAVLRLLRKGFPDRSEAYWRRGLTRHRARPLPPGVPRYGFLLEHEGEPVGVLLALCQVVEREAGSHLRCNLSSWYMEPRFRALGVLLDGYAMRDRTMTYVNVSPAPHTWAMHEVRGFRRFCQGQMLVLPALSRAPNGQSVRGCSAEALRVLPASEARLVSDHHSYGCISLVCAEGERAGAIIFQRRSLNLVPGRRAWPRLPCFQVVYRSPNLDLSTWLGAIGRHLLRHHAMPWFVIDADGPVRGAFGRYFAGRAPKVYRGPNPPDPGDLSYTEIVLFGA
ncbi:hypothetical protein [Methylobacterium nodulans]|uniref:Uncharacterized protein n=1 Tax=Methylobacterium nodulans (strain LMG 21967 / CNCM I-2342 / ORS 2060) TaxID=460265 RepID=B8IAG1_METNO|nr:hypothetical protein [Methylobacterium nodulans]ACL59224.1 conserved hypothetical protein [Methylobacterium nodulans ORS 2060]